MSRRRRLLAIVAATALVGALLGAAVDVTALPVVSPERITAVLLVDGQAYFGHLLDDGTGGTIRLADVYYFQDARSGGTGLPLGLVKRGNEAHQPADGMRINRDKVLAIERLAPSSSVVRAIAAERGLGKDTQGSFLERRLVGDPGLLAAQRAATENALVRGYAAAIEQLKKARTELTLPVSAARAQEISDKATADLRSVRRAALGAIATAYGMPQADADAYVRTTDARLEAVNERIAPILLAPSLYAIVARADQLYAGLRDDAITRMTKPGA